MAEILYNAWSGWTGYTDDGKLPALLMAVLLFLWFGRKRKEQRALLVYASVMTVCCILPVTAAMLMLYQTKFYNYEWIWSLVPATAVTAFGLTVFWTEYRAENAGQRKKILSVTLFMLAVLLFCGSLGKPVWDREEQKEERTRAYSVVGQLSGRRTGEKICLWAPREIMEYAREKDADILLPYGRNIWDGFLNAYSYDVYDEDTVMMEQWMENLSMTGEADMEAGLPEEEDTGIEKPGEADMETGLPEEGDTGIEKPGEADMEAGLPEEGDTGIEKPEGTGPEAGQDGKSEDGLQEEESREPEKYVVTLEECVGKALERGVNCIMIANTASGKTVARMEKALGTEAEVLEGYYLFVIQ